MTGLMMKDALVMRKTLRLYALFLLFYSGLAVLGVFPMSMALAMVEVIVMVLPISSFSYDEAAKWDRYAAVLPVGRTAVVKARYLFLLLVLLAAAVLCALTEECMDAAGGKVHFVPMAGALAITLAAAGSVKTMMGLGQETVEELNTFSKALLPTLSAAVGLTTLHQDPFAMGVAAGHMVLDAIAGKSIEPAFVRPDTPLILRETTAPPAATAASAQA